MKRRIIQAHLFASTLALVVALGAVGCSQNEEPDGPWVPWPVQDDHERPSSDQVEEGSGEMADIATPSLPAESERLLPEELVGSFELVSVGFQGVTVTPEYADREDGVATRAEGSLQISPEGTYQLSLGFIEDEDCRGVKECIDGRCMSRDILQVWERARSCQADSDCEGPLRCYDGHCTTHEVYVHVNGRRAP